MWRDILVVYWWWWWFFNWNKLNFLKYPLFFTRHATLGHIGLPPDYEQEDIYSKKDKNISKLGLESLSLDLREKHETIQLGYTITKCYETRASI